MHIITDKAKNNKKYNAVKTSYLRREATQNILQSNSIERVMSNKLQIYRTRKIKYIIK